MPLIKSINAIVNIFLNEDNIEYIRNLGLKSDINIEGGFLTPKQSEDLQKQIESKYSTDISSNLSNKNHDDIRMNIYNYDNPLLQRNIYGVDLRVTDGLIEQMPNNYKRKTYLLYANGIIIGKFYNPKDIINIIKYIENE